MHHSSKVVRPARFAFVPGRHFYGLRLILSGLRDPQSLAGLQAGPGKKQKKIKQTIPNLAEAFVMSFVFGAAAGRGLACMYPGRTERWKSSGLNVTPPWLALHESPSLCFCPMSMWPWVITYASILGQMNTHVPPM